ncbi:CKLF-like MARVEL transmembrane domain-containing protein 4 isoform X2 [Eupeodes corollae]|uniref:CKLF-like MARVEL transmembrane domain-containing protein 4 isoform X2 n=1 Tax=Eupeodes corollae TaxID=290404 RepID=UPI00248F54FF|nr:CKLF-like MARVEL transmembrane domain-containing protein 4 isoform X2 [Eupeodes corollae]
MVYYGHQLKNLGYTYIFREILGIICMILASPPYYGSTTFFLFVVVVAFIATILWSAAYFLGIREALTLPINWLLTEIINTGILTILYLTASIIQMTSFHGSGSLLIAAFFGIVNFLAYAAGSYFLYLELRMG